MKVLQLSKFYPPVMGGIESVAWELTEGLNRAGVPTDVLCSNQRPVTRREHVAAGYRVVRSASLGLLLSTSIAPPMPYQLWQMARGCDVLHVHMPDPMAAATIRLALPRCKLVVHWHSDVIRQRLALKLYEPLQHWLLSRADAIVATSEAYAGASPTLRRWRDKTAVIPIGITDNQDAVRHDLSRSIRQRFGGRRIVFSLGRMTYYKGYEVLIEAAAALPDDSVVLIGGDGELFDHYAALIRRRGMGAKVHLLGHVDDNELPSHFDACDVFCMASTERAEAYGVAMLEAMVMGKPIVASDIAGSGVPWVNVHGSTGFNVPVAEPKSLAAALTRLLGDEPLRLSMGAAARRRYLQSFDAALMTRRTIQLYRRL